jgi:hypothetical protein
MATRCYSSTADLTSGPGYPCSLWERTLALYREERLTKYGKTSTTASQVGYALRQPRSRFGRAEGSAKRTGLGSGSVTRCHCSRTRASAAHRRVRLMPKQQHNKEESA